MAATMAPERWRRIEELYHAALERAKRDRAAFLAGAALFQTVFREGAYGSYAASKDGQRLLMNVPPEGADLTPITVVLNWTVGLK